MTHQIWLAPLQGYTERLFREAYAELFTGIDNSISPFISALPEGRCKDREWNDVPTDRPSAMPVVPQIMGNKAEDLAMLANRLYDEGHPVVNLNLGCPYKMVAKKKKGSGILCFPDELDAMLETMFSHMKGGLSIKTRLGRHTREEFQHLVEIYNRYPLDNLTVHPRTGVQMYKGDPDFSYFEEMLPTIRHRVIYNGDLWSVARFEALSKRFPTIDEWMIGRWIVPNPFLPSEIKGAVYSDDEKRALLKQFHHEIFRRQEERLDGPGHLSSVMKAFWVYFKDAFADGDHLFKPLRRMADPALFLDATDKIFDQAPELSLLLRTNHS